MNIVYRIVCRDKDKYRVRDRLCACFSCIYVDLEFYEHRIHLYCNKLSYRGVVMDRTWYEDNVRDYINPKIIRSDKYDKDYREMQLRLL